MKTEETIPVAKIPAEKIIELDVRPVLKSGGEPFSMIMSSIEKVPSGGALKLRATFEPVPLFRVLGSKGWKNWKEYGDGEDWMIWFYRDEESTIPEGLNIAIKAYPELAQRLKVNGSEWKLDVRDLPPPEPMEMTLAVLEQLPAQAKLLQINNRVPQFLLPLLEERGLVAEVLLEKENEVHIEMKSSKGVQ